MEAPAAVLSDPSCRWGRRMLRQAQIPVWAIDAADIAKRRARRLRRPFAVSLEHLQFLAKHSAGLCQLTGIAFRREAATICRLHPYSPSLDRIDSSRGYVDGNIRFVCLLANFALGEWGDGVFWDFVQLAAHYRRNFANMDLAEARVSPGERGKRKLRADQVAEIKASLANGIKRGVLARRFDVHWQTIDHIHKGRTWRDA